MPARIIFSNVSSELDAGPSVQTIFVWHGSVMRFTGVVIFFIVLIACQGDIVVVDDEFFQKRLAEAADYEKVFSAIT
jgi:hypothetical protein